ncbi:MAG: VWA domain-containing protein [Planctomycetes bacterium]|nr:VWA domain-containing protein [Planctomycetota bacterium]
MLTVLACLIACGSSDSPPPKNDKNINWSVPVISNWPLNTPIPKEIKDKKLQGAPLALRNYVVIFDDSGSMGDSIGGENKIDIARKALARWIKTIPDKDNVGLVTFHSGQVEIAPLKTNREKILRLVNDTSPNDGTPLSKAMADAYNMMITRGLLQLGYGEYTIVVVTDGEANDKDTLTKWVNWIVGNSPVQIFTIGLDISSKNSLNRVGVTTYREANNYAELERSLGDVTAESPTFDVTDFK